MPTSFPTGLDSLTNPVGTDPTTAPDHAAQHANANDAIEALEAKVGINASAVSTSLDNQMEVHAHTASADDGGIIAHSSLSGLTSGDPHTQYQLRSEKDAASGYVGLSASSIATIVGGAVLGTSSLTTTALTTVMSSAAARKHFEMQQGAGAWAFWLGTETTPYLYVGGNGATSAYSWRANWNATADPANTFKSASGTAAQIPLAVMGAASQSANLQEWRTSTPTTVLSVGPTGWVDLPSQSAPSNPAAGTRRLFTDSGTGELSVRTSGGTTVSLETGGGGGGSQHLLKEAGTPMTARAGMNFGAGFDLADDAVNNETDIDLDLSELPSGHVIAFGGDTNLYRGAGSVLKTDDLFHPLGGLDVSATPSFLTTVTTGATGDKIALFGTTYGIGIQSNALVLWVNSTTDGVSIRTVAGGAPYSAGTEIFRLKADGKFTFGSAADTNLYRGAADSLVTDDAFTAAFLNSTGYVFSNTGVLILRNDAGVITWGAADDVNLYRSAADMLKTDDSLTVVGTVDLPQQATPSNPPSGTRRIFTDSATGEVSVRTSAGATVSLETGSAPAASEPSFATLFKWGI